MQGCPKARWDSRSAAIEAGCPRRVRHALGAGSDNAGQFSPRGAYLRANDSPSALPPRVHLTPHLPASLRALLRRRAGVTTLLTLNLPPDHPWLAHILAHATRAACAIGGANTILRDSFEIFEVGVISLLLACARSLAIRAGTPTRQSTSRHGLQLHRRRLGVASGAAGVLRTARQYHSWRRRVLQLRLCALCHRSRSRADA